MAVDARGVRLEERLRIKIGEAKNLPGRSHGITHRDTYCVLSLDQEEIFRTSIVEKSLNPFFGEEFQFEVPRGFRYLSIYIYDRDRQYKQDRVLGKVAIRREELKKYDVDNWFALGPVDADSEVQGKAHIEIGFGASVPKITSIQTEDDAAMDSKNPCSDSDSAPTGEESAYYSLSSDRKNSRSKGTSKNFMKFGSCSSTSSKKLLSYAALNENVVVPLERSESLRRGQAADQQPIYYTCGPSSSKSMKMMANYESLVQKPSSGESCDYPKLVEPSNSGTVGSDYLSTELFPLEGSYYNIEQYDIEQYDIKNKLSIRVLECSELTLKNGQCDPYAEVTVYYKSGKKVSKKTKAKKKTVNPKFDECLMFDLLPNCSTKDKDYSSTTYMFTPAQLEDTICEVVVSLWHENFFLGEVRVPLQTPDQRAVLNTSAWYFLASRHSQQGSTGNYQGMGSGEYQTIQGATPSGTQFSSVTPASLGHLRLMLRHTLDRVLPPQSYDDLRALLLKSPLNQITSSAVYILGDVISTKTDIAQPFVRLFLHANLLIPTIRSLADAELSTLTDSTTIFRGNTLVSKMMDEAMKLTGLTYLQQTLRPIIELVLSEKKPCEIDPTRIKEAGTIETNLANLKEYIDKIFTAITQSFVNCPAIMCRLFDALRQCAAQKFPTDPGVRYSVVSGFIFLRFFAPAILGPRLFDLTTKPIDPQINRTLTLISKMIQTLGNLVSSRNTQHYKEEYMMALHKSFCTERHVKEIKQFLEIISTSTETQNSTLQETPVLLKEGVMIKRAQRKKRFLRANIKKRHFQLTSCELSYSKARGKKAVCVIPLSEIVAVAPVREVQNLNMKNMFQIVHKNLNVQRALYIQANNCVEMKEWLDLLGKLCEGHRAGPKQYHPSSYLHGHWECCSASKEDAPGCAMVSAKSPPAGIHLRLDPSRDLQRIHCLLYKNISTIEQMKLENVKITHGVVIEDPSAYRNTLNELIKVTYSLEDRHRAYQRSLDRETKYGSKQAPIGDDNYLHLASSPIKHSQSVNDSGFTHFASSMMNQRMAKSIPLQLSMTSPKSLPRFAKKPPAPLYGFDTESIKLQKPTENIDAYLNNSLYIGSSNESVKTTGKSPESPPERPAMKSESAYLKMLSRKNDSDITMFSTLNKNISKISIEKMKNSKSFSSAHGLSEYVQVRPPGSEKENVCNVNAKKEDTDAQFRCPEYDLLSDFSTYPKNKPKSREEPSPSDEVPPDIPPRGHFTNTPPFSRYYKKPLLTSRVKSPEPKSLEHYNTKLAALCESFKADDARSDAEAMKNSTEDENPIQSPEETVELDDNKEKCKEVFSKKSFERKSLNKSKKPNSSDSTSIDGESSSKTQSALTDRFTPSFLKKKAKVNAESVCLPIC